MLPRVVLHNVVSVDGRIDWFTPDVGQFYELAMRWKEDATLAGSDTICGSGDEIPAEDEDAFQPPEEKAVDKRPILVIPDSRGKVRIWHALKKSGYWRRFVALCSQSTPKEYLDYLDKRYIDYIVTGDDRVDFRAALEELTARYGITLVRVDSGGTLNGVLLRDGLVDEVSVLIDPSLVGGTSSRSIFRAPGLTSPDGVIQLRLSHVDRLKGDVVWLRYEVIK